MLDLADEAMGDLALATMADRTADETADDKPVILGPKEEAATMQECEHCGWHPCGCGG